MYFIENYQTQERFNNQYEEISKFLQIAADAAITNTSIGALGLDDGSPQSRHLEVT